MEPLTKIDLAHEPDFRIGGLFVRPSSCSVAADGLGQRLEPRVMQVLVFLARAANHTITRDELISGCWDGRAVSDDAVARVIAKVRGVAREVRPSPFVLETLPKVGFRLVTAPADSVPPPARPRLPSAAVVRPLWRRPLRRPWVAVAAIVILALAAWVTWRAAASGLTGSVPAARNGRVEVMLFEPLRSDADLRPLSSAVADAVIRSLSQAGVETAPQPKTRDAGGSTRLAEIRIAGSVDRDDGRYMVNSQILDRRSGVVLWSQRMDRPAASAAGFHEEVANRIGDVLHCALRRREAARAAMAPRLFALFLQACAARRDSQAEMMEATRQLVRAAPHLSGAHSLHGVAAALMAVENASSAEDAAALVSQARASARRALELDPENGEAYLALALSYGVGRAWKAREENLERALALDAELVSAHAAYLELLREVGRVEEAAMLNERTIAADRFSASQLAQLAMMRAGVGDLPGVERLLQRVDLIRPQAGRELRWTIAFWWEDPNVARKKLQSLAAGAVPPADLACLEDYLDRVSRPGGAARGLPTPCAETPRDWRIRLLARQGDLDGAYAEMALGLPASRRHTIFLFYPEMKRFRQDPRFMPLAARLGLVDYWRSTGRWPDFCSEPDLPYDCRLAA